ncbi:hypothetical protein BBP40_007205 [Aspergillus hancockii]|nr:hypothetical protein BBP40_007205 [Aspergillus hancockii]
MDAEKIFAVHSMLQLVYHRNKNQHGKTKWWRWLSVLKRITWALARSLDCVLSHSGTEGSPDLYRRYLGTHVVPRCYQAFSTVVADVQFSALGTVLLGTLARLVRATGVDKELNFVARRGVLVNTASLHGRIAGPEDVGEVLLRNKSPSGLDEPQGKPSLRAEDGLESNSKKPKTTLDIAVKKPKNKKRQKRKDAIDNLFEGLL